MARLPSGACSLDIAGNPRVDPGYTDAMQTLAQTLGLSDCVRFLGMLDDAGVAERLAHSHVLAAPSSYEGFGIVYVEGMGFGLPALATTAGGAATAQTVGFASRTANLLMWDYHASTNSRSGFGWTRANGVGLPYETAAGNSALIDFFMMEELNSAMPTMESISSTWAAA